MKLLIDADGCPVTDIAVAACAKHWIQCLIICDFAHVFNRPPAETITVSKGADSADLALFNRVDAGDIVITQDYGLAAICLAKKAVVLNQDGMEYTNDNIDALLLSRHTAREIRQSGGRLKGPAKRTREQDERFKTALSSLIEK